MYAIRKSHTMRFFKGYDRSYEPPRPIIDKFGHKLIWFKTAKEAIVVLKQLGPGYELIQLPYVVIGEIHQIEDTSNKALTKAEYRLK